MAGVSICMGVYSLSGADAWKANVYKKVNRMDMLII
jgi:hypothetical protein